MGILVFLLKFSLDRFDNKTSEAVSIKMIHDEPVYFVDEEDIRNIVTQSNPSKKIGNIDVSALKMKITQLPMVDSANVYLKLNGELNLDIIQRIPIFRLKKLNKEVCSLGEAFERIKQKDFDILLTVGAGNIDTLYDPIVEWLS